MALLTIESTNPALGWVIFKNPQTQQASQAPFEKPVRKGMVYAWYPNEHSFRLWFTQNKGEPSFYKNQDNNYLNADKAICAYAYCAMVSAMLEATLKKLHEKDVVAHNKVVLHSVWLQNPRLAQSFAKHLSQITIHLNPLGSKLHEVCFEGETTLHYLLNALMVFCLMQALEDRRIFIDLTPGTVTKYTNCLNSIDAPYYIVYSFLSRCVTDINVFHQVVSQLKKDNWKLNFGNTQRQRFSAIKKVLTQGKILHDIGCGELFYSSSLCHNYEKVFAWDSSEEQQARNARFIEKRGFANIELRASFDHDSVRQLHEGADLLITEMLEHVPKEIAVQLLQEIAHVNFSRLVITLPNADFNKHYLLQGGFRHDDHCWEPTYEESVQMIRQIFPQVEVKKIGDMIDEDSVATMFIINKQ